MKVRKINKQTVVSFDSAGEISNDFEKEEETELIKNFIQPLPYFDFPQIENNEIEKFKKKLIAFTIQYGSKNEKTTSIFLNYLQSTREFGVNHLKNNELLKAATYFSDCLNFIDPEDQVFLEKFIIIKIDVTNKLMYCVFELFRFDTEDGHKDGNRLDNILSFMEDFMYKIRKYSFYQNLLKSESCLIEMTYFFMGRLYRKKGKMTDAIVEFKKSETIIDQKLNLLESKKKYVRDQSLYKFLVNLKAKIDYKISKCYRNQKSELLREEFERKALNGANKINQALFIYINRKIRFYRSKKKMEEQLAELDGRKRIEEEILRLIEENKQAEIVSLYDIHQDEQEIGYQQLKII